MDNFNSHEVDPDIVAGCGKVIREQGVTLRRSIVDENADISVEFEIESIHDMPVAVRIRDALPMGQSADIETCQGNGTCRWRSIGDRLELSTVVTSDDAITTGYSIHGVDSDRVRFDSEPAVDAVQPIDPDEIGSDDGAPLWRSAASTAVSEQSGIGQKGVQRTTGTEVTEEDSKVTGDVASPLLPADSEVTPTLSVVMPTLDEEGGIGECIDAIVCAVERLGVTAEVIVSDSSTDRTPEIAREKGAIVVVPDGRGYGYAYRYAFQHARGEYIAIGDADTTYDFEALPELLEPIRRGEADMVMGSRLAGEIEPGAMPALHQHIGNPLLTRFLNTFYGAGVSDAHSGFRVIKREALDSLELTSDGMEFASEMIMAAGAQDLRIAEVPITYHEREGEATLDSFQDGWRHVKFMLVNAPGYVYSVPGLVLGLLGAATIALVLTNTELAGVSLGIHSLITGSALSIIGHQLMSLGVFATVAGSPISRPDDPITTWITDRLNLERGALLGGVLTAIGGSYALYSIAQWIASGFAELPLLFNDVLALTLVVLGIQTVFYSLFMTTIYHRW